MKEYGEVLENIDLKKYNSYGIGGQAKYLVYPNSIADLQKLLIHLNEVHMPWLVLGGGTNVILPDEDFAGVIIKLDKLTNVKIKNDVLVAECGISLARLIQIMLNNGYTNYGNLLGIPGLLGGAIIGNAGAYGCCIFDYLIRVTIMDNQGNIKTLEKDDIKYDYRKTNLKDSGVIVIEAELECIKGNVVAMQEKIKENAIKRSSTQPLEYKNAGSVFKNPPGLAAGYMIEHAGLKGFIVGGAKVSEKHANFIINYNNATSHDIINLIEIIKKEVKKKYNVQLELEQIQITWWYYGKQKGKKKIK